MIVDAVPILSGASLTYSSVTKARRLLNSLARKREKRRSAAIVSSDNGNSQLNIMFRVL